MEVRLENQEAKKELQELKMQLQELKEEKRELEEKLQAAAGSLELLEVENEEKQKIVSSKKTLLGFVVVRGGF